MLTMQKFSQSMQENLINDLMDLAKLENNKFQMTKEYFSLPAMIHKSFQILLGSANQNNIKLVAEVDNDKNLSFFESILSDERRLQQTMLNFLSNALKFTNKGGQIKVLIKIISKQAVNPSSNLSSLA